MSDLQPQPPPQPPDQPPLPADVPPPLRAAVAAALAWLRELDREAADDADAETQSLRRPR